MSNDTIARVRFFEGQFLGADDMTDEQAYHIAMRRRHNLAHHTWGIVAGLEIVRTEGQFLVLPGLAVDGYGREVILQQYEVIPLTAFEDKGTDTLDVFIQYGRVGSDQAPKKNGACQDDGDASFYRWQELPILQVVAGVPDEVTPRAPGGVPAPELTRDPTRTPTDNPQRVWQIFLAQIRRSRPDPSKPYEYEVDLGERPYAGLVGEAVQAPSGRAHLQVGAELESDRFRFGVFIPADTAVTAPASAPQLGPRLGITRDGMVEVRGATTLRGDLTMDGGAIDFIVGPDYEPPLPSWRVYRARGKAIPANCDPPSPNPPPPPDDTDDLRIEIRGEGKGTNVVAIGYWSDEDKKFHPCLTVDDQCNVTVAGNLKVDGLICADDVREGGISQDANIALRQATATAMASSLLGGSDKALAERAVAHAIRMAPSESFAAAAQTITELSPSNPSIVDLLSHELVGALEENQFKGLVTTTMRESPDKSLTAFANTIAALDTELKIVDKFGTIFRTHLDPNLIDRLVNTLKSTKLKRTSPPK